LRAVSGRPPTLFMKIPIVGCNFRYRLRRMNFNFVGRDELCSPLTDQGSSCSRAL